MKKEYKQILNMALSSLPIDEKINIINKLWNQIDENKLFEYANIDELVGHIAYVLKRTNLSFQSFWNIEYEKIESRITLLMDVLDEIALELKKNNIQIVALKNAGITKAIYKNHASSPMGDLDLLVRLSDFKKAHEILMNNLNFNFKFRSKFEIEEIEHAIRGGGTEYYKIINGTKVWLELQWRPIAGRWIQPHNEPNGEELINRSIHIEGSSVRILCAEDNLLQVALHTAKHSYVRAPGFRLHSDVDRVVRFQKINWESFLSKVLKLKVKNAVYFSLYLSKQLLFTPVPDKILLALKPFWLRAFFIKYFIKKAGIYNQNKRKFTKIGYIIFSICLYDSISENFKSVFPSYDAMRIKYPIKSRLDLPFYYSIRIFDLLFKRAKL